MKNNKKVENAIGNILKHQKELASHVSDLSPSERRRTLMYVANFATTAGYSKVLEEAIDLLGLRNEEVLVFATACLAGRPIMVPHLVKRFCDDTSIARQELARAATLLMYNESKFRDGNLLEVVDCIILMKADIGEQTDVTYLASRLLKLSKQFGDGDFDRASSYLREQSKISDSNWDRLMAQCNWYPVKL
jgi:hypothetical protein